jgi:hypothetical protein
MASRTKQSFSSSFPSLPDLKQTYFFLSPRGGGIFFVLRRGILSLKNCGIVRD